MPIYECLSLSHPCASDGLGPLKQGQDGVECCGLCPPQALTYGEERPEGSLSCCFQRREAGWGMQGHLRP